MPDAQVLVLEQLDDRLLLGSQPYRLVRRAFSTRHFWTGNIPALLLRIFDFPGGHRLLCLLPELLYPVAPTDPVLLQVVANQLRRGSRVCALSAVDFGNLRGGELLIEIQALEVFLGGRPSEF